MDKLLILSLEDWHAIRSRIQSDYGASVLISWKCQEILGFAPRYHQCTKPPDADHRYSYQIEEVHLDFLDPDRKTFFVMKYL